MSDLSGESEGRRASKMKFDITSLITAESSLVSGVQTSAALWKQTGDKAYLKQVLDITEEAMGKLDFTDKAVDDAEGTMKLLREVIQGSQRLSKKAASEAATAYKQLFPDAAAFPYEVITTDAILALANGLRDGDHPPDIPPVPEPLYRAFIFQFALDYTDKPFEGDQQGPQIAVVIAKAYHVAVAVAGQPFPTYQLVEPVEQGLGLTVLKATTDMRQEQVQAVRKILGNQRREYQGIAQPSIKTVQQATESLSECRDIESTRVHAQRLVELAYSAGLKGTNEVLNMLEHERDLSEAMLAQLGRHPRSEVTQTEMLADRAFTKQEASDSMDVDEVEHVEDSKEGKEDEDK